MAQRGRRAPRFFAQPWDTEYAVELETPRNLMYKQKGKPRARESASQLAQLEGVHRHGTSKGVKMSISKK